MDKKINIAVIGVGHLGKEHARIYAEMPDVNLCGVVDTDCAQGERVAKRCRTKFYRSCKEIIGEVDAASVVVPTKYHYEIAKELISNGINVLVEKPMTGTISEAEDLIRLGRKHGSVLQAGYIERFNPALQAIQKIDTSLKFIECHRLSPFTFRSADIGVVLDLMIHDIDIILFLAKSKVKKIDAVGVNVISNREDIANARIQFENGCVANITASRVSFEPMRKIRLFSEDSYISLDYQKQEAIIYRKSPKLTLNSINVEDTDVSSIKDLKDFVFGDLLKIERIRMDNEEPLKKELESFVRCVRNRENSVVPGEEGIKAIKTATIIEGEIRKNLKSSNLNQSEGKV
ncbi:MAG: gfo/Idh/MocA family oxidoreductase [Candidatus Scalindua sp. AMX11]|nr:MAG: gfo/Idh/MocA family oxidoreductase [Candidatus Scalindua sp.]NOG85281.1 Gfo/Idh/MocA family oxidoreductase [Planctomycetota bacterium]RZV81500.1 MAG: Gfo/Idh/MocA family oxidoreductase [Candidatus Scalindua sp. SCAELEC01]TDE65427.1 MAG: gfo/Idh/MocA family oxidoreductase [Candidatus Scalindua sp. AMX11]GJQ59349.1 MAG: UDP-N-acetylglucosamine 3-dehydrogenase [Candidatus Scalindua sp.]